MTNRFTLDELIRTKDQKDWAADCANKAMARVMTARLALESDTAGICPDAERACVVSDVLEVAYSFMAIAAEGADLMQREGPYGH
mgnify:CR=1 FL=1